MEIIERILNFIGPFLFLFLIAWFTVVPLIEVLPPLCFYYGFSGITVWCFRVAVCFLSGEVLVHFLCASCFTFRHGVGPQMSEEKDMDRREEEAAMIPNEENPQSKTRCSPSQRALYAPSPFSSDSPDTSLLLSESDRLCSMRWQGKHRATPSRGRRFFSFVLLLFSRFFLCPCYSLMHWRRHRNALLHKTGLEDKRADEMDVEDHHEERGGCFRSLLLFFACKSRRPDLHSAHPLVLQAIEQYIHTAEHVLTPTQRRCWLLDAPRRYCHVCHRFKAPREHHCHLCRECVAKMDHHCVWIGQCVDGVNGQYFLSLLCWSWISCLVECLLLSFGHYVFRSEETQMMIRRRMEEKVVLETHASPVSTSSSSPPFSLTTLFGPHADGLQSSSVKTPLVSSLVVLLGVSFFLFTFARNVWTNTTSVEWEVLEEKRRLLSAGSSFRFENPYRIVWPLPFSLESFSTASLLDMEDDCFPSSFLRSRGNRSNGSGAAEETRREGGGEVKDANTVGSPLSSSSRHSSAMPFTAGQKAEEEKRNEITKSTLSFLFMSCRMRFWSSLLNILEAYGVLSSLTKWVSMMEDNNVVCSFSINYRRRLVWSANGKVLKNFFHCSFSFSRWVAIHLAKKVLNTIDHFEQKQQQQEDREDRGTVLSLVRQNIFLFLLLWRTILWVWLLCAWLLTVPMIFGTDDFFDGFNYPLS